MNARTVSSWVCGLLLALLCPALIAQNADTAPVPLTNVHAHNDYEHKHPLFDALSCGICSVEADINLVDGKLLVAHSLKATKPDRTLQSLYLEPLRQRIGANGGRVFRDGPPVWLLIDFKTDPKAMFPVLRRVLEQYSDILTVWKHGQKKQGAVTAILTGDHPAESVLAAETTRYAAIDGTLESLKTNPPADLVPWMSSHWTITFSWRGKGPFAADERQKLREIVDKSHRQGRLVRFWGGPDNPDAWRVQQECGVDLLNTDDLRGIRDFLAAERKQAK
jgi:hypothetical protein